jgi:hypothetical protein
MPRYTQLEQSNSRAPANAGLAASDFAALRVALARNRRAAEALKLLDRMAQPDACDEEPELDSAFEREFLGGPENALMRVAARTLTGAGGGMLSIGRLASRVMSAAQEERARRIAAQMAAHIIAAAPATPTLPPTQLTRRQLRVV